MAVENIWTYYLNSQSLAIDGSFGLTAISISCISGTILVVGYDTVGGLSSQPCQLSANQTLTFSTSGSINVLQLSIDATAGECNIIGKQ